MFILFPSLGVKLLVSPIWQRHSSFKMPQAPRRTGSSFSCCTCVTRACVLILDMRKNHHLFLLTSVVPTSVSSSVSILQKCWLPSFCCPRMPWMMCALSCQSCRLEVITFSERTAHLSFWTAWKVMLLSAIYEMQWCPRNKARSSQFPMTKTPRIILPYLHFSE